MLLKQLPNNFPICLEGLLTCIWTQAIIRVNVFIQKNAYYIHNYFQKSMENRLFRDKCSFSSYLLSQILPSFMESFKTGVAHKSLTYKIRASSSLAQIKVIFLQTKLDYMYKILFK